MVVVALSLERLGALEYLEGVSLGAPLEPLSPERAGSLSAAVMSTLRPSFSSPVPLQRAVSLFVALLQHPDLPNFVLSRIAADGLVGHPDVFGALVSHPAGLSDDVFLVAALSAWEQAGPTAFSSGPFAELSAGAHNLRLRAGLLERLELLGSRGRLAAYLLREFPQTREFFTAAFALLGAGPRVWEVALVLLEDARASGVSSRRDAILTPALALDRARLVLST